MEKIPLRIYTVRKVGDEVRHYTLDSVPEGIGGSLAVLKIDGSKRLLHMRYHTAAHLLAGVVEQLLPGLQAIKGHQFPGEAYLEFKGTVTDEGEVMQQIKAEVDKALQGLPVDAGMVEVAGGSEEFISNPEFKGMQGSKIRIVKVGPFKGVPCGGTHVESTTAIGSLQVLKLKTKAGVTKVSYQLAD